MTLCEALTGRLPFDGTPLEILRVLLEEAPADLQVLLLSRTAPPQELAPLEASRRLERLPEDALSFQVTELAELLPDFDDEAIQQIHQLTHGWSAGIVLAVRCWSHDPASRVPFVPDEARSASKEAIFRFFAEEVVRSLQTPQQRLLEQVSLLDEVSASDAEALTGMPRAAEILETMYRRNLFTSSRRGTPRVYQFHALFREFLQQQLARHLDAAAMADVRQRAGRLLAARNVSEALAMFAEAGDWTSVSDVLVQSAPALLQQGRFTTLCRWIDVVPSSLVDDNPWLLYWRGQASARMDGSTACDWWDCAYRRFPPEQALGRALCASAAVLTIHVEEADYTQLALWSGRLRAETERLPARMEPSHRLSIEVASTVAAILDASPVEPAETAVGIDRALDMMESDPDAVVTELVPSCIALLHYCIAQRDHQRFQRVRKLVVPRLQDATVSPSTQARWLMLNAVCKFCLGLNPGSRVPTDYARMELLDARVIAEREQLPTLRLKLVNVEVGQFLSRQDRSPSVEEIAAYSELVDELELQLDLQRRPFAVMSTCANLCGLRLLQGRVAEAVQAADRGLDAARRAATPPSYRSSPTLAFVYALIAGGREDDALRHVDAIADTLPGRMEHVAKSFGHLVRAWQHRGTDEGLAHLQAGFADAVAAGWTSFLLYLPEISAHLCSVALAHDIQPAFVRECIARRNLPPPPTAGPEWPWRVQVRVMGPFDVRIDGRPASLGAKVPRRQVELLQAIAASGAAGLDARHAVDVLWPDGQSGKTVLDVTLHRLRKWLGPLDAIVVRDGKLHFDPRLVFCDVVQLEATCAALLATELRDVPDAVLTERIQRVLDVYRGSLLTDMPDTAWMLQRREYLRARFERAVRSVGAQLERHRLWTRALDVYARALEHDNLAEHLYRGVIRCHLALSQPSEALTAFRRCRHLLSVVLGVAPAPQTMALVRDLTVNG